MIDKISLILRIISIYVSIVFLLFDIKKYKEEESFRTIKRAARKNGVKFEEDEE